MIEGKSIVCFANDWNSDPTSKHQLMKILARKNKVLWINSIGMRTPSLSSQDVSRIFAKIKELFKGMKAVAPNLYVVTPLAIPFRGLPLVQRINKIILRRQIRRYVQKLRMKDIQVWTFIPTMADLAGNLGEKKVIYYCVDDWSKFSFLDREMIFKMESRLVQKADVVIASSRELYEQKRKLNSNTHLVNHGVDHEHFSKALEETHPIPDDMKNIRRPVVGFFGLIHEWIDLSLLKEIAQSHPEWSLVLIGKVVSDVTELTKMPNVFFLGQKKYQQLPGYCKTFDVAIIPFVINELTKSVNPIKLREYLAAGLPVVSVDLPEVRAYGEFVKISPNVASFIMNTEAAIGTRDGAAKVRSVKAMERETWQAKLEEIGQIVFRQQI